MRIDELKKSSGIVRWRDAGNSGLVVSGQALQIPFQPLLHGPRLQEVDNAKVVHHVPALARPSQGGERAAVYLGRSGAEVRHG